MKVHIVKPNQQPIEGYQKIEVGPNQMDLGQVADNECTFILANEIADSFSVEQIGGMILALVKKLRMNGEIVVGGTDIRLFSKMVLNQQLGEVDACKMVGQNMSMSNADIVTQILRNENLQIHSVQLSGVHYEVTAKRV